VAKGLGNNYYLYVESTTPGTYTLIKGQGDLKVSRSSSSVDLSSKADFPYALSAPGLRNVSITCDIKPDLPDANGYTRLETLCAASPQAPFNVQIRKGGLTGAAGDVIFQASMYGTITETSMGQNAALTVSLELTLAGAPTTDVLAV
jgi:hypothetical protein